MTIPLSELWTVQHIDNAGRGVVASQLIPQDTILLRSGSPTCHVIFKQYAKETCAQCFLWDRGRTLRVRENELGKVFCSEECRTVWTLEQGADGVEAWRILSAFLRARANNGCVDRSMADGPKPSADAIRLSWQNAAEAAEVLRKNREKCFLSKAERKALHAIQRRLMKAKQADILAYFLDGLLFHYRAVASEDLCKEVHDLAMDDAPYKVHQDLEDSCTAFLQLTSILPPHLTTLLTTDLCLNAVRADNHNAFGIRAGGEDSEEYMGYAVYPSASYFNHSCGPNVHKKRIGRYWEFRAARDIPAGEECCITYLGGDEKDLDVVGRRDRLRDVWGFICQCARCNIESKS